MSSSNSTEFCSTILQNPGSAGVALAVLLTAVPEKAMSEAVKIALLRESNSRNCASNFRLIAWRSVSYSFFTARNSPSKSSKSFTAGVLNSSSMNERLQSPTLSPLTAASPTASGAPAVFPLSFSSLATVMLPSATAAKLAVGTWAAKMNSAAAAAAELDEEGGLPSASAESTAVRMLSSWALPPPQLPPLPLDTAAGYASRPMEPWWPKQVLEPGVS
mmetsp:Transcript_43817/g.111524  ORF Transcript_43817/g.111524 Transcript_43817/m.111524 type:complete len:218 (-) Transcript_43817:7-660(-)